MCCCRSFRRNEVIVARMERSDIRERRTRASSAPGFRSASPALHPGYDCCGSPSPVRASITSTVAPSATWLPTVAAISVDGAVERREQRVLHLHRLDDGDALALLHDGARARPGSPAPCRASAPRPRPSPSRCSTSISASLSLTTVWRPLPQHVDRAGAVDRDEIRGGVLAVHRDVRPGRPRRRSAPSRVRRRRGSGARSCAGRRAGRRRPRPRASPARRPACVPRSDPPRAR